MLVQGYPRCTHPQQTSTEGGTMSHDKRHLEDLEVGMVFPHGNEIVVNREGMGGKPVLPHELDSVIDFVRRASQHEVSASGARQDVEFHMLGPGQVLYGEVIRASTTVSEIRLIDEDGDSATVTLLVRAANDLDYLAFQFTRRCTVTKRRKPPE